MEFKQFMHNFLLAALLFGMLALPVSSLAVMKYNNSVNRELVLSARDSKKDLPLSERLPGFFSQREDGFIRYSNFVEVSESSEASETTPVIDYEENLEEFVVETSQDLE